MSKNKTLIEILLKPLTDCASGEGIIGPSMASKIIYDLDQARNKNPGEFDLAGLIELQKDIHKNAVHKGWWDGGDRNDGEIIALMHSELSEGLEALRHGNPPDDKVPEFSGIAAELADVIIRILDFAEKREHDVIGAIIAKHAFNKTRSHKHGGKQF